MFAIGDKIKLNDEMCPTEKRSIPEFQFGKLGYLVAFLDFELEILNVFEHSFNGTMVTCKVLNDERFTSNITFIANDCVKIGATKFNIDYEVLTTTKKNQTYIDELTTKEQKLLANRKYSKALGLKVADLKSNWSEITKVRSLIKKELEKTDTFTQFKTRHGLFTLATDSTDTTVIQRLLRAEIKKMRKEAKTIEVKTKEIAGSLNYSTVGGVLTKSGVFSALNEKFAVNVIKEHKKPTTNDNYIGIEIEMLSMMSIDQMNKEFIAARLHRTVNVGTDGSIRADQDGSKTMELRILVKESELESKLKEICAVLRKNDCYSNRSCGMHVHLDMRNRDAELCYKNLFNVQDLMLASQPIARRSNTYCKPNTDKALKLSQFKTGERYKVINTDSYEKHSTIEIRLHEGATKFKDIYNWVKFLVDTVNQKKVFKKEVKTIDDLTEMDYTDIKILNHLDERIQEYAS
jgi:hypothetical protein